MKKYIWIMAFVILGVTSCDTNEVFEKELYKKVVAFICSDNYNVLEDVQELTGGEISTFIALSSGGTGAVETDVRVTVIPDMAPFNAYNIGMFDVDAQQYARLLPESKYDIDDYHIIIPKGERSGRLDIKIRPDGLSPDTVYFIPLSIGALSAYEVNPKKSSILYRVLIKNFYAEQQSAGYTFYSMRGTRNDVVTQSSKQVQPISENKVRMMAGNISFDADEEVFASGAVILEVQSDNSVIVSSYKDLEVTQDEDPDFPNIFRTEEDDWGRKYKVFLLAYTYKVGSSTYVMREELRLQYTED